MAGLSGITVNVGQGGLGRRAISEDGISGLLFYNDTPPSGFTADTPMKVFSLEEAVTLGIVEGGTYSVEWYHISEFFRANPDGETWIGFFDVPGGAYDFLEVVTFQSFTGGEIRLVGVYAPLEAFATTQVTALQAAIDTIPGNTPLSAFLSTDMSAITAVTGWGSVGDLRADTAANVTYVTGQDGGAAGLALFTTKSYSISVLGRILGDHSLAAVNQSVAEVGAFNISNGIELETPAMANGDLVSALTSTALGSVKDKGYAVIRKRLPEVSGTYHERTPTAVVATSDFSFIENQRVVDKTVRLLTSTYTPYLNSRVLFNTDGTLADSTVGFFTDLGQAAMDNNLEAVSEISGSVILIDPTQDVQSTSTLVVTCKIQPTAIAEFITINISLVTEL